MEESIIVDAEEKKKRELRMQRFGVNDSEYLQKIAQDKSLKFVPEDVQLKNPKESYKIVIDESKKEEIKFDKKKLMLFGVNLMNTEDIETYMNNIEVKIKKIFWLNDFTCLVELDNEEITLRAFETLTGFQIDKDKSEIDNYNWKKSKTFVKMNRELDIEVRIAVEGDVDKKSERKDSVFYRFYSNNPHKQERRGRYNNKGRRNNYYNKNKRERSRDKEEEDKKEDGKVEEEVNKEEKKE